MYIEVEMDILPGSHLILESKRVHHIVLACFQPNEEWYFDHKKIHT